MINNFGNTYLFFLFIFGCVITPAFYSYKLWEAKAIFKKYNIDESATQVQRFAAAWPMAESITALLIIYFGPQGTWSFFVLGLIVFTANLILGITNAGVRILRTTYLFSHVPNNIIGRAGSVFSSINVIVRMILIFIFSLPFFLIEDNIRWGYFVGASLVLITLLILLYYYKKESD